MLLGLSLSVSWICLLFNSAACLPATKGDYRYPYTATWGSSGGPAPALQPASSAAGIQSPSSVVEASSQNYAPSMFTVTDSSSESQTGSEFDNGSVSYAAAPSPSDSDGPPGLPWAQPAGGADASFYDFSNWMPSQPFPDFRVWSSAVASNNEMPQTVREMPPPPPSSYIVQSRNGYMRAREVLSNTRYSPPEYPEPEYPEPPPRPVKAVREPSKSGPVTGPEVGVKM